MERGKKTCRSCYINTEIHYSLSLHMQEKDFYVLYSASSQHEWSLCYKFLGDCKVFVLRQKRFNSHRRSRFL